MRLICWITRRHIWSPWFRDVRSGVRSRWCYRCGKVEEDTRNKGTDDA